MINLPLTANVLFVHHFHGVTFPPKNKCQKIFNANRRTKSYVQNKLKYRTFEDAEATIKKINMPEKKLNAYKCSECGYWHIGKDVHGFYSNQN